MSPLSPPEQEHDIKPVHYGDLPTATSTRSNATISHAGPSGLASATGGAGGIVWTKDGPVLKMENAVMETV